MICKPCFSPFTPEDRKWILLRLNLDISIHVNRSFSLKSKNGIANSVEPGVTLVRIYIVCTGTNLFGSGGLTGLKCTHVRSCTYTIWIAVCVWWTCVRAYIKPCERAFVCMRACTSCMRVCVVTGGWTLSLSLSLSLSHCVVP